MPLHNVFESVVFGFLEVVAAVEWVEPDVQEEVGPVIGGLRGGWRVAEEEGCVR